MLQTPSLSTVMGSASGCQRLKSPMRLTDFFHGAQRAKVTWPGVSSWAPRGLGWGMARLREVGLRRMILGIRAIYEEVGGLGNMENEEKPALSLRNLTAVAHIERWISRDRVEESTGHG